MKQNRETVAAAISATKRQMSDFFHHGIPSLFYILHVHTACVCVPFFYLPRFSLMLLFSSHFIPLVPDSSPSFGVDYNIFIHLFLFGISIALSPLFIVVCYLYVYKQWSHSNKKALQQIHHLVCMCWIVQYRNSFVCCNLLKILLFNHKLTNLLWVLLGDAALSHITFTIHIHMKAWG